MLYVSIVEKYANNLKSLEAENVRSSSDEVKRVGNSFVNVNALVYITLYSTLTHVQGRVVIVTKTMKRTAVTL